MTSTPLDARYAAVVRRVRQRVIAYALGVYGAGEFRTADEARFVSLVVPVVLAGQRQVSALTDAYLAQVLTQSLGRPVRPSGASQEYPRPTPPAEVYARPYVALRFALSEGKPFDQAKSIGVERLKDIAATDMQLAKTHTARRSFTANGVQRYQRTLTGSKNCALCYVASTQTYSRKDLMPIHPGCDCGVAPADDSFDRDAELAAAHEAIQERFGTSDPGARAIDYRKALLVREHGDMGPVLTVAEHRFTGKHAIPGI